MQVNLQENNSMQTQTRVSVKYLPARLVECFVLSVQRFAEHSI